MPDACISLQVGDKIVKAEVVDGLQYLQEPK